MVEQWSSKSFMWVRFLLPLFMKYKKFKLNKHSTQKKLILSQKIKKNFQPFIKKNSFFKDFFFKINKKKNLNSFLLKKNFPVLLKFFFNNFSKCFFYFYQNNNLNSKNSFFFINNFFFFFYLFSYNNIFFFFNFNFLNYYFFYYLNSFILLSKNTAFFKKNQLNFFSTKTSLPVFFNNTRHLFNLKKNDFKCFKPVFSYINPLLLILEYIKKIKLRSNYVFFIKNNFFLKEIFKKSFLNYMFLSKLFFFKFKKSKFLLNNVFKLIRYDWITNELARLTKQSLNINANLYFILKLPFSALNIKNNVVNFWNNYNVNDALLENNYLFFLTNKTNKEQMTLNKNTLKKTSIFFLKKDISLIFKSNFSININPLRSYSIFSLNSVNFFKKFYFLNSFESLFLFFFQPLFFKYSFYFLNNKNLGGFNFYKFLSYEFNDKFYYLKSSPSFSNIMPDNSFYYVLKKKILKVFSYSKFPSITSIWYYNTLVRFLEFCSGKKICLRIYTFLNNHLNFFEKAQCLLWAQKVKYFRKVLGPRLFLNESLQIIYLALKLKDPFILTNWIAATMQKISFWKYKTFLRYIKYVLRYFFWIIFKQLNLKGIKFQLKGKISVAGNARTRTVRHNIGFTSHTTFNNKILYKLDLVKTFTGVLGLKLWLVF